MEGLISLLITLLVTAVCLFLISKIPPLGIEIDSFGKAVIAAIVFGILNAIVEPILRFFGAPITFLTLGLFAIVINAVTFGLAAWLVEGFRLRHGFMSALLGAIALAIINYIISEVFGLPNFAPVT
jgi:putative membrane protein